MRNIIGGLLILVILPVMSSNLVAQGDEISRDEDYAPFRAALAKSRTLSRRHIQKIRSNWNGKVREEEWTYEYHLPDRIRYLHLETVDGKTKRTEQINIGETKYCRKGDAEWTLTKTYCIGGDGSGGPSSIVKEVFRREKTRLQGKPSLLYLEQTTYKNVHSKTAESDGLSFWESKYWIDNEGFIRRYETRRGLVKDLIASYEMVETHEYDPSIKIEAPIK